MFLCKSSIFFPPYELRVTDRIEILIIRGGVSRSLVSGVRVEQSCNSDGCVELELFQNIFCMPDLTDIHNF